MQSPGLDSHHYHQVGREEKNTSAEQDTGFPLISDVCCGCSEENFLFVFQENASLPWKLVHVPRQSRELLFFILLHYCKYTLRIKSDFFVYVCVCVCTQS